MDVFFDFLFVGYKKHPPSIKFLCTSVTIQPIHLIDLPFNLFKKFICIGNLYLSGDESNLLIKSEKGKLISARYQKIEDVKKKQCKKSKNVL